MEIDDPEEFGPRNVGIFKKIVFGAILLELVLLVWFMTSR
jgi:hypothetical protein